LEINKTVIVASRWFLFYLTYIDDARSNTNQVWRYGVYGMSGHVLWWVVTSILQEDGDKKIHLKHWHLSTRLQGVALEIILI